MKSLNQHIEEKLKINKDSDIVSGLYFDFNGIEPKNTGTTIEIAYTVREPNEYNYVELTTGSYIQATDGCISLFGNKFKKNSKGFYEITDYRNRYWNQGLLFGDDAILFLTKIGEKLNGKLSSTANVYIDVSYIFDNKPVNYWPMKIRSFNNDTDFSNYDINNVIKHIR